MRFIVIGLLCFTVCVFTCQAAEVVIEESGATNGILALERVVDLPKDQNKWHLSIVGDPGDSQYKTILSWFDIDASLKKLKYQVHFREIDNNTEIYRARYAPNVKGLPTVRLQKSKGEVVYESHGKYLPISAGGLYGAIANSALTAQGRRSFSPWRIQRTCPNGNPNCPNRNRGPCPCPKPKPDLDPAPDPVPPPIDDGEEPEFDQEEVKNVSSVQQYGIGAFAAILLLTVGGATAGVLEWKKLYDK